MSSQHPPLSLHFRTAHYTVVHLNDGKIVGVYKEEAEGAAFLFWNKLSTKHLLIPASKMFPLFFSRPILLNKYTRKLTRVVISTEGEFSFWQCWDVCNPPNIHHSRVALLRSCSLCPLSSGVSLPDLIFLSCQVVNASHTKEEIKKENIPSLAEETEVIELSSLSPQSVIFSLTDVRALLSNTQRKSTPGLSTSL